MKILNQAVGWGWGRVCVCVGGGARYPTWDRFPTPHTHTHTHIHSQWKNEKWYAYPNELIAAAYQAIIIQSLLFPGWGSRFPGWDIFSPRGKLNQPGGGGGDNQGEDQDISGYVTPWGGGGGGKLSGGQAVQGAR